MALVEWVSVSSADAKAAATTTAGEAPVRYAPGMDARSTQGRRIPGDADADRRRPGAAQRGAVGVEPGRGAAHDRRGAQLDHLDRLPDRAGGDARGGAGPLDVAEAQPARPLPRRLHPAGPPRRPAGPAGAAAAPPAAAAAPRPALPRGLLAAGPALLGAPRAADDRRRRRRLRRLREALPAPHLLAGHLLGGHHDDHARLQHLPDHDRRPDRLDRDPADRDRLRRPPHRRLRPALPRPRTERDRGGAGREEELRPEEVALRELASVQEQLQALQLAVEKLAREREAFEAQRAAAVA